MELKDLLAERAKEINNELEKFLPKNLDKKYLQSLLNFDESNCDIFACNKALVEPAWNLLSRGGKRWRPFFMQLVYFAFGGIDKDLITSFLPLPELIHNGTLIIDDIEDNSDVRRGKPCVHKIFGTDIAVNAGNFMYYLPYSIIKFAKLSVDKKLLIHEIVAEEMLKLHFGQGMDIYWHNNYVPKEEEYLQMCAYKTGTLARLSAKIGAVLADATKEQINLIGKFAESIGVAFQIQDDILNITNTEWGKELGDDITEGKKSLIVIKTLEHASLPDQQRLIDILQMQTKDKALILEAITIMKKYPGIKDATKVAQELVLSAWKKIDEVLPTTNEKSQLKLFANFIVEREI